ncbi:hypothetical protein ACLB1R_35320 [Escherichia coli]
MVKQALLVAIGVDYSGRSGILSTPKSRTVRQR